MRLRRARCTRQVAVTLPFACAAHDGSVARVPGQHPANLRESLGWQADRSRRSIQRHLLRLRTRERRSPPSSGPSASGTARSEGLHRKRTLSLSLLRYSAGKVLGMGQRSDASSTSRQRRRSTAQVSHVDARQHGQHAANNAQRAQCRRQTNRSQARRTVRHGTAQHSAGRVNSGTTGLRAEPGRSTCNMLQTRNMRALWQQLLCSEPGQGALAACGGVEGNAGMDQRRGWYAASCMRIIHCPFHGACGQCGAADSLATCGQRSAAHGQRSAWAAQRSAAHGRAARAFVCVPCQRNALQRRRSTSSPRQCWSTCLPTSPPRRRSSWSCR